MATLECPHCGGIAIERVSGVFGDGDGDECEDCGFPGHVSIDEDDGPWWNASESKDALCARAVCVECYPLTHQR